MRVAALAALLYGARRYWRNWGTTKQECAQPLPGDELLHAPKVTTTEGVLVDRPVAQVWPWAVRLGRSRTDDRDLTVGDTVCLVPPGRFGIRAGIALPVVKVVPGETIVLHGAPPAIPWDIVWSVHLISRWDDRCRLLVRTRVGLRHPAEFLLTALSGPLNSALNRRLLVGIKRRAEQDSAHPAVVGVVAP